MNSLLFKLKLILIIINVFFLFSFQNLIAQAPSYPDDTPQVNEKTDSISILFPQKVGIVFERNPGKFFTNIKSLWVENREILSMPAGYQLPPELIFISNDSIGNITSWADYLLERKSNNLVWEQTGERTFTIKSLDSASYLGYEIDADTVIIKTELSLNGSIGELQWIFFPVEITIESNTYSGLSWKLKLTGLDSAVWLNVIEPVQTRNGDWAFAQLWGKWLENKVGSVGSYSYLEKWYFADMQPFYFSGGISGSCTSFFDDLIGAMVSAQEEAGRHFLSFQIPLGVGHQRTTPAKVWLWSNNALSNKLSCVDEWTNIYDWIASSFGQDLNLGNTKPKPTIFWGQPELDYYKNYLNNLIDTLWLDKFRINELPKLAQNGFRVIYFQAPWNSDAEHPSSKYLPGSGCWGSGNAPWDFKPSEAIGGAGAMKTLIAKAHELGVKIVLWSTPGHLSNSSPLFLTHPDWIKWRYTGVPEDFDWGDVTGTSQFSGYLDYAVSKYIETHSDLNYDGIWQDSFLTFGILPDYKMQQPVPTLKKTIEMQQLFWQIGMTEVHIEGCGPLGLSTGGFGHEPPIPEDLNKIRGKEYGLYHYVADVYPEPDSYYKTLACGGVIGVASLEELQKLPTTYIERIKQANYDYLEVMDKMYKRKLIGFADTLKGVEWKDQNNQYSVLFAFNSFTYTTGYKMAKDVTTGDVFTINGVLTTIPYHTFLFGNSLTDINVELPDNFELFQNFPNPFNSETIIKYTIPAIVNTKNAGALNRVQLKIYDVLGREVKTVIDKIQKPGNYKINLNLSSLPSGVYFYRLHSGNFESTKKMILLK